MYTPRQSAVWLRSLGGATDGPCGISTAFCGAIGTQFCFTYSLGGVTAMPLGLHARLCHAFLVLIYRKRALHMRRAVKKYSANILLFRCNVQINVSRDMQQSVERNGPLQCCWSGRPYRDQRTETEWLRCSL